MSAHTEGFRLSPQQEQQWIIQQRTPGCVTQCAVRLPGAWRDETVRAALEAVIMRHEALRTTFHRVPGMSIPIQVINPDARYDWRTMADSGDTEGLATLCVAERHQAFDLEQGPLLHATFAQGDAGPALILTVPAITADAWSLRVAVAEIAALCVGDELAAADDLPQYLQFAGWQAELLSDHSGAPPAWTSQPPSAPVAPPPFAHAPAAAPTAPARRRSRTLPAALSAALNHTAALSGTSPDRIFMAAWAALFWHHTGQPVLELGVNMAFRHYDDLHMLVGPVGKIAPLRLDYTGDFRFEELIRACDDALVQREEWLEMTTSPAPAQAAVGFRYAISPVLPTDLIVLDETALNYPWAIQLECGPTGAGEHLTLNAHPERFDDAALDCLLEQLEILLTAACAEQTQPIADLPLLGGWQRQCLLGEWNQTSRPSAWMAVHDCIAHQADRCPDAIAVQAGGQSLTYAELDSGANQLARRLLALGAGPEILIAVALTRSPALLIAVLGILKAGAAYVPLDLSAPAERNALILASAGCSLAVTERGVTAGLTAGIVAVLMDERATWQEATTAPTVPVAPDQSCYVIHTSGSTGAPKGVVVTHRGLANYLAWAGTAYGSAGGAPVHSPLGFDLTITSLFVPLMLGQTVTLLDEEHGIAALAEALRTNPGFGFLKLTPAHLEALTHLITPATLVRAIHGIVVGGEALRSAMLEPLIEAAPDLWITNEYGPTETVVGCCTYTIRGEMPGQAIVPIGRPIINTRLYVVDQRGELAPVGLPGELYVGGAGVARGYLNRPDLTAERFIPDRWSGEAGARLYRTGDLARYAANGALEFLGRNDFQVKVRGFRVEPGEIETHLKVHPAIRDSVVVLYAGGSHPQLIGYYVVQPDLTASPEELARFLKTRVPDYMIPGAFIPLPTIPMMQNGKVDRTALPAPLSGMQRMPYVPPRTPQEKTLAGIWTQVLGIDHVGLNDSFFTLGGDSILGVQVVARAHQVGLRITPRHMFDHPTLAELAAAAVDSAADPLPVSGTIPLGPIQHWFFELPLRARHHWNQAVLLEVAPQVTAEHLASAINALQDHHDMLRVRFMETPAGWQQIVAEPIVRVELEVVNLDAGSRETFDGALLEHSAGVQTGLDLANGPLVRAVLYRQGHYNPAYLLIVAHHLLVDGVSWRILLEDLQTACDYALRGETIALPPKTQSFKTWSEALQAEATNPQMDAIRIWTHQPFQQCAPLPRDGQASGTGLVGAAQTITSVLERDITAALLREAAPAFRATINELLLAALVEALAEWTGRRAALVEMDGHGRTESDLDVSRTVGWFTALYPLALAVPSKASLRELVMVIKEQVRQRSTRTAEFGVLREIARVDELRQLPHPEIAFNYLGQFDQLLGQAPLFSATQAPIAPNSDPHNERSHLLELTGLVSDGQLSFDWTFAPTIHQPATIERLATAFNRVLRDLVREARRESAVLYSPVDFPLINVTSRQLAELTQGRLVNDVYPLTATQTEMYTELRMKPGRWAYFNQLRWQFEGRFDPELFLRACANVAAQLPILRTVLGVVPGLEPLQIVLRQPQVAGEIEDWTTLSPAAQRQALEERYEQDCWRGFDLGEPLWRVAIMRLGTNDHALLWSHHHLILDGWSMALVMGDVFAAYQALERNMPPPAASRLPFGTFVAWWEGQRWDTASEQWRFLLADYTPPASLPQLHALPEADLYGETIRIVPTALSDGLRNLGRQQRLTLNTIVQSCWGLVMAELHQSADLTIGVTLAGRPAELAGVEGCVGLLINTLPMRVQVDRSQPALEWFRKAQEHMMTIREHENLPVAKIAEWTGQEDTARFASIVRFENYPTDQRLGEMHPDLHITHFASIDRWPYPLSLIVKPGPAIELELSFWRSQIDESRAAELLAALEHMLAACIAQPGQSLGALLGYATSCAAPAI